MDSLPSSADYNQLRAFVAVAEALSFSRAAETLGVTPSALSQTLRGLETSVGVRLLHRTTRSVSLTSAGERLLQEVTPSIQGIREAMDTLRRNGGRPSGRLRIHTFRSAAENYIEPILGAFARDYPEVVLDITLDDEVVDVVGGGYDAALRLGEVIERDMIAVPLGPPMRQIAAASPDYLARHGVPLHPRDLLQHRCIRWRWPGQAHAYAWEFFENGAWFEVTVDGPLVVSDKTMAVRAAVQGVGICFTVEYALLPALHTGELVPLLEDWSHPFPGMYLCYPQQRQMAPALRAFIDAVRDEASRVDVPAIRSLLPR
ncbi:LysR family transcriptional regulator [Luteibacter anthropi]|uniref:LysR family transcriptional regulator n=1 Tax=Luteibacter anthropi TaxID=564369 RepID=UPI002032E009|nr:LysR family transcriptional regulator [Luteibacter anthropi]